MPSYVIFEAEIRDTQRWKVRQALDNFYDGSDYQRRIAIRNELSSARFVSIDDLPHDPSHAE